MMRIFVDMDGTLAKWNNVEFEQLFEEGYYRNLEPNMNILNEVNYLIEQGEDVYILSAYLTESNYAKKEKQEWVKEHLPKLPEEKQIFVPYGTNKAQYLKDNYSPITNADYLIDDYTKNLLEWKEFGGIGIKYLNGINHTKGTWQGITTHGSLYTTIATEKLKSEGIDLVQCRFEGITCDNNKEFKDYNCYAIKEGITYQYILTFETKEGMIKVNDIVEGINNLTSNKAYQRNFLYGFNDFPDYYKTHYPTISQCKDFDILCKELPGNILDDVEYTIYLYDETHTLPQYCEAGGNAERISEKYIEWYESLITTKDLLDEIPNVSLTEGYNNNIDNIENNELDEPDI